MRRPSLLPSLSWCLSLSLSLSLSPSCSSGSSGAADAADVPADAADVPADVADVADAADAPTWTTPFEPGVEASGPVTILRLKGTPYEMGVQHGTYMKEKLKAGAEYVTNSELGLLEQWANASGFIDEAKTQSYPAVLDECTGMASVTAEVGWTLERCLLLAYGDVALEHFNNGGPTACSQFVATRGATPGGRMVHGRSLDWDKIDFLLENPVLIVRHPTGAIPYVTIGFPGDVVPYSGMNAAGISVGSNEANSKNDISRTGRAHIQMLNEVLRTATSLADARAFLLSQPHMTAENLVVADGDHDAASVFELTATHHAERTLSDDGVVFATNHFVDPSMVPYHLPYGPEKSSMTRWQRLTELVPKDGKDSLYGTFEPATAVQVLRDRHNPYTGEDAKPDQFDGAGAIAANGCVYSIVFVPQKREFYLAAGPIPIPANAYRGYSLDRLFGVPGAQDPTAIP